MQYDVTGGDNMFSHRIRHAHILGSIIIGGEL